MAQDPDVIPLVHLVGELNPYGADPRHALYDWPAGSSGERLRRMVLGLTRASYLRRGWIVRTNLCEGVWSRESAAAAARVIPHQFGAGGPLLVLLGRKVQGAFGFKSTTPPVHLACSNGYLLIPHPSGLSRAWNDPDVVPRIRRILTELVPQVPWGELDQVSDSEDDRLDLIHGGIA